MSDEELISVKINKNGVCRERENTW